MNSVGGADVPFAEFPPKEDGILLEGGTALPSNGAVGAKAAVAVVKYRRAEFLHGYEYSVKRNTG